MVIEGVRLFTEARQALWEVLARRCSFMGRNVRDAGSSRWLDQLIPMSMLSTQFLGVGVVPEFCKLASKQCQSDLCVRLRGAVRFKRDLQGFTTSLKIGRFTASNGSFRLTRDYSSDQSLSQCSFLLRTGMCQEAVKSERELTNTPP